MPNPHFLSDSAYFDTAAENMRYDEHLLSQAADTTVLRWYEWQKPGITISHRQTDIPAALDQFDASGRITGGGLLFHSPGDLVFGLVGSLTDLRWGTGLKAKLCLISKAAQQALTQAGFRPLPTTTDPAFQNRAFCHTYQSPYEIAVGSEKIVALTLRKMRHHFIVQGIFHLNDNHRDFKLDTEWHPYLSHGLITPPRAVEIGQQFEGVLTAALEQGGIGVNQKNGCTTFGNIQPGVELQG